MPLTMENKASDTYFEGALIPAIDQRGDNPVVIRLSDEERDSGTTRPETIQQCLYHYHRDGFVVLENAIDDALVDDLYSKIVSDTEIYVGKKFQQWNQGKATKNVSVAPPLTPEWLRREFYANVHMMRVVENVLGPKPELRFINSNVAIPGATGRQAVHSDVNHKYPAIPFGIVVNTYLQDSDEKNGVTELWAGTHNAYEKDDQQATKESGWIKKEYIQKQAKAKPPVQPRIKKGSICFRDLRLWHAGMPNKSDHHRIMLAIDYFAAWYQCPMRLTLPLAAKAEIDRWEISTAGVDWHHGEVDYLNLPFYLNMTQDPKMYIKQTEKGVGDWRARLTGVYEFDTAIVTEQNWYTPDEPVTSEA